MLSILHSATNLGLTAIEIDVEVDVAEKGFPGFGIVGLASKSADEAKERIKTAIVNTGLEFPNSKITVNLAPADTPKDGSCYDLPISIGIISSFLNIKLPEEKSYFYGELSLDGSLHHTKGVFLLALLAKEKGVKNLFVPRLSANEACVVQDINIYPVDKLSTIISHLNGTKIIEPLKNISIDTVLDDIHPEFDFSEISGQEQAKRALEIAAAGGHNVLMIGPPGSGKTMLSKALAGILPNLTEKESLEVTKIYSVTGNIPAGGSLIRLRPFRSPHHTTSQVGLIGGGSNPRPGEVSLAHRGVLFLDEFPEFTRVSLEALRQPIEDGYVTISRASGSVKFPAQFMLIAAANPCQCGFLGDPKKQCKCTPYQVIHYQKKLSGPILDRIDMHLNVPSVDINKIMINGKNIKGEGSVEIKDRIIKARNIQSNRFEKTGGVHCNADMKNSHIKELANISDGANILLKNAVLRFNLSARTYFRMIKLSRTIADLDTSIVIEDKHVAEALQYRIRNDSQ